MNVSMDLIRVLIKGTEPVYLIVNGDWDGPTEPGAYDIQVRCLDWFMGNPFYSPDDYEAIRLLAIADRHKMTSHVVLRIA